MGYTINTIFDFGLFGADLSPALHFLYYRFLNLARSILHLYNQLFGLSYSSLHTIGRYIPNKVNSISCGIKSASMESKNDCFAVTANHVVHFRAHAKYGGFTLSLPLPVRPVLIDYRRVPYPLKNSFIQL